MALFPNTPAEQYRLLGILVAVGAAVLYWLYVYSPRQRELDAVENRLAEIQTFERGAETRTGILEEIRRAVRARERELDALRRLIPERAEVAALYQSIAVQSRSRGLELVSVSPTSPQPDESGQFLRQEWEMTVEGAYHEVARFMTEVASLDRIVRPAVVEVSPTGDRQTLPTELRVELRLETFIFPPEGATADDTAEREEA